jgi:hypothetical protein
LITISTDDVRQVKIGKPTGDWFETMGARTVPDQSQRHAQSAVKQLGEQN